MSTAAGEQVLLRIRTHPKVLFKPAVIQLALIVAHVAVVLYFPAATGFELVDEWGQQVLHGLILLLELTYTVTPALSWWHTVFVATDRRLLEHWGILSRHVREIPLDRIASVDTERGILDRIFGCGTLVFHDVAAIAAVGRGQRGSGIRFHDVPRVAAVRELIDSVRFGQAAAVPR